MVCLQDEQHNAKITYSIYDKKSSGNVGELFEVDLNSGAIILKRSAAKLENQVYQFFIRAQDGGNPPLHSEAPIEIYIMSNMDRPPVFEKGESVVYLSENGPVGQVISTLKASLGRTDDGDSDGGSIRYKLATAEYLQNDADPLFQIDKEGRVIVSSRLDREKRSTHKLTFLAETDTSPTLNAYYELTVQVLDKNDNSPKFAMNNYNLKVSEAVAVGTPIIQINAEDADYGNNGEVKYSFFGEPLADIFSIDPHNGWITTQSQLDFEEKKSYSLQVMAVDNGNPSLTATTEVKIEVVDVNDNPPVFYQKHYTAAVNEGALPGTIIFALETEDKDIVAKTDVEYFITSGDDLGRFQVKKNGEVYVARKLDRETVSSYHLNVMATDGTFVTSCKVTIEILDDNDSPPVCNQNFYREVISESVHPGTYILSITATDADEGSNARQIFYLTGDSADVFSLDRDTGMLKTSVTLDREKISRYSLEAHVQDAGVPEWECVSKIEIEVSDSNDNSPVFSQDAFSTSLKEDIPVGSIVTKIHASDLDLGMNRKIEYDFLDSAGGHFRIDPSSGIVSLSKPLDREERAMYNLTVRATDNGRPRLSSVASLMILVLDVNDNPPEFASKYYFATVSENVAIGSDVVRLLATSRDTGVNAEITYSIIAGNEHRKFKINAKSGVLVVAGEIDHEASKDYFLTIQAQDGGDPPLSNHATVNITVQDVNDNPPIFARPSYTALIKESADIGNTVASVSANDLDFGENGRILYSIVGGDRHGQFAIDNLGVITVSKKLDREMTSSYVLDIEAADHGLPVMSSTVLVNVDIEDVNDNPPVFPGEFILLNNTISNYTLKSGKMSNYF
jgi:protocadherin Fat 1/2/3